MLPLNMSAETVRATKQLLTVRTSKLTTRRIVNRSNVTLNVPHLSERLVALRTGISTLGNTNILNKTIFLNVFVYVLHSNTFQKTMTI